MTDELLKRIIALQEEQNILLSKIFALFSKYDDSYSEEVIKENHFNIS